MILKQNNLYRTNSFKFFVFKKIKNFSKKNIASNCYLGAKTNSYETKNKCQFQGNNNYENLDTL